MNLKRKNALTLAELVLASSLVALVLISVTAVDVSIRNIRKGISRNSLVAMRTSATMLDITKNASLASGTRSDPGITDPTGLGGALCIRLEDPFAPPLTPGDFSDDIIVCYSLLVDDIHKCEFAPATAPTACLITDPIIGTATNFQFILPATANPFLEINLTNRFDVTSPADPQDNPEYILITRVSPSMHSF